MLLGRHGTRRVLSTHCLRSEHSRGFLARLDSYRLSEGSVRRAGSPSWWPPAPRGCRASGAARLSEPGRALIQLSFRYRTDDHFWFTFFHEVGHLLLHAGGKATVAGAHHPGWILDGEGGLGADAEVESEANRFAEEVLTPSALKDELLSMRCTSDQVIRFGRSVGISAGIVVGQLQYFGRLRHNQLNRLKRRFSWEEVVSHGTV